jgi:hypothetical protein
MPVTTPWGCDEGATDSTTADGAATGLAQVECAVKKKKKKDDPYDRDDYYYQKPGNYA